MMIFMMIAIANTVALVMVSWEGDGDDNGQREGDIDECDSDGKDDNDPEIDNDNSARCAISRPEEGFQLMQPKLQFKRDDRQFALS